MNKESILLKDLQDLFKNKSKYEVSEQKGEYNETFIFYKHPKLPENIFMKETYHTDSYGYGDLLVSVEFVEGKTKTITAYEPI